MTQMAQEITYSKTRSSRNSKTSSHNNINTTRPTRQDDEQLEMVNPFLVNQSNTNSRTVGNLMIRWSDRKNKSDLIENPEQGISSLRDEVT